MLWKRKTPGPTGTGCVIENINWFFWDDPISPGLIHREKFNTLARMALPEAEVSQMLLADGLAHMITAGKHDRKAAAELQRHYSKIAQYLTRMRENRRETLAYWIDSQWDARLEGAHIEDGILLLKAIFNVLQSWGYPFQWRDAYDSAGHLAMVIVSKKALRHDQLGRALQSQNYVVAPPGLVEYCVRRDEIVRITGRPYEFTIECRSATWSFDHTSGNLAVISTIRPSRR